MITHQKIWAAIDKLAERNGLSPSGLARRAGLDPTTFNKSKRTAKDGRLRWPSTESLAKIVDVTGSSDGIFSGVFDSADAKQDGPRHVLPVLGMAQAGMGGFFDDGGYPVGQGWEEVDVPLVTKDDEYALRISGDSMLPVYREGDIIVVSASQTPRPGDRVVAKTIDGEVMAKVLVSQNQESMTLMSLNPDHETRKIPAKAIEWIVRITWASQ